MTLIGTKSRTAISLGITNIIRIALYRIGVRIGINPVRRLHARLPQGPFFSPMFSTRKEKPSIAWQNCARYFGWYPVPLSAGASPDWHINPFSGGRVVNHARPWWLIPDFDIKVGDIKTIWEASRFDWVTSMAQRGSTGESGEVERLNDWLMDWCRLNPPYLGPNWKCGQEASIRVMHLAMAALIAGQVGSPNSSLLDLIEIHLKRIAPTLQYAMAQDNNHITSEAAALFIGGSWLAASQRQHAKRWEVQGQRLLESRVARLITPDGSFSQYSVNYHRMMMDTLSMVEIWRRFMELPAFSDEYHERAKAAALWLNSFVDGEYGDVPNIGANDGARLLPLTDTDYRDYRPSVQLGCILFCGKRAFAKPGSWDIPLTWLNIPLNAPTLGIETKSKLYDHGGYALLVRNRVCTVFRYPKYRFRPSHADALHIDLWVKGLNLLRDSGSYSYNTDVKWQEYFSGTSSHNTIQFDDRDQMPRLSRFLFGDWLTTDSQSALSHSSDATTFSAAYRDRLGARHSRELRLCDSQLNVCDRISGFKKKAVLRWRLAPGEWRSNQDGASCGNYRIAVSATVRIIRIELAVGWESRYYGQKKEVPVLEIEVHQAGQVQTRISWDN